jgi:hypothetical protein
MKSQRVCVEASAAKQACFSIHDENSYASGKSKRPRGPRSSLTLLRPHFDLQTLALAYYLEYHLQRGSDVPQITQGLPECVSSWKISGRVCPMVDLALSSLALAIFSRIQQHAPAATEASSRYYRVLQVAQGRIAQLEIPTLDVRNIDSCLLAVFLMGRYETVTHRPDDCNWNGSHTSLQSWCHHDGAMAILKVWHDKRNHDSASFIIKQTRSELIKSSLLRNIPLPDWMLDGNHFGEHGLGLDYDRVVVRIVNLHHKFASLEQKNERYMLEVEKMNNEARELDTALQDWATHIPSTCAYQRHILSKPDPWPMNHFYSLIVYSYPRPGNAAAWGHFFAVRMLINSTRLRMLELTRYNGSIYEQQRQECTAQLEAMADNLAYSIPFSLGRFKVDNSNSPIGQASITLSTNDDIKPYLACWAIWPLTIASSLDGISVNQRIWFRSELAKLGRITGDGVLECAETDQWAIL